MSGIYKCVYTFVRACVYMSMHTYMKLSIIFNHSGSPYNACISLVILRYYELCTLILPTYILIHEFEGYFFLTTAAPDLPDAVSQDHSQDTVDRTTVINWQPVTGSDSVTYTVTNGSDLIMDFDNTMTTATVRLPAFNTDYSFCIDAVNVCGATSGTPRCATPPVRIGAEGKYIALLYEHSNHLKVHVCI